MKAGLILFPLILASASSLSCRHTAEGANHDLADAEEQVSAASRDATQRIQEASHHVETSVEESRKKSGDFFDRVSKEVNRAGKQVGDGVEKAAKETSKAVNHAAKEVSDQARVAYEKGKEALDMAMVRAKVEAALLQDTILNNKNNQIEIQTLASRIILNGMVMTEDMKKLATEVVRKVLGDLKADVQVENKIYVPGH